MQEKSCSSQSTIPEPSPYFVFQLSPDLSSVASLPSAIIWQVCIFKSLNRQVPMEYMETLVAEENKTIDQQDTEMSKYECWRES